MAEDGQPAKRRVLLIDDDPALMNALVTGLTLLGINELVSAADGASGLERLMSTQPDCVVVDVRMPGLDGYQFIRAVRGDPATAQTPLIVLSALVREHEQLAGLLSGADAYLLKPVKLVDLMAAIERAVEMSAEARAQRLGQWFDGEDEPAE